MEKLSNAIKKFWENIQSIDKEKVKDEEMWHQFDNAHIDELWGKIKQESEKKENFKRTLNKNQVEALGELETNFFELALNIIYGGHIAVKYDNKFYYNIYIDTVEFYFHCEDELGKSENNILNVKDPIMYHRKERIGIKKQKSGPKELPYLQQISLYAHNSGYDITFENKDLHYRASALIRAYTVTNGRRGKEEKIMYRECTKIGEKEDQPISNDQRSTYLYDILNGFSLLNDGENSISWEEDNFSSNENLIISPRTNVLVSKNPESYDDKEEFSEDDIKGKENRFSKKQNSTQY